MDRDWAFGFAGAKVDESVRTASTGIGGSGQEGGDGERGRSNRVRDTGEGEVVGPAEGKGNNTADASCPVSVSTLHLAIRSTKPARHTPNPGKALESKET